MKNYMIASLMLFFLFSLGGRAAFSEVVPSQSEFPGNVVINAIKSCVDAYSGINRGGIPSDVDRAYTYYAGNIVDVIFSHGEQGTFGRRSDDYRMKFACRFDVSSALGVTLLKEKSKILIGSAEDYVDIYKKPVLESLYLRVGALFKYQSSQQFSEEIWEERVMDKWNSERSLDDGPKGQNPRS